VSKTQKQISSVASDLVENDSVYDFLYHDPERIASFLAQFNPHGHLKSLLLSEGDGESSGTSNSLTGKAGVPGVVGLDGTNTDSTSNSVSESMARTYDPLWLNALSLLDFLQQKEMLCKDVASANIGQFVIATASLWVVNMDLLKSILASPKLKAELLKQTGSINHSKGGNLTPLALAFELLSIFPHGVQAHLISTNANMWCSLKESGLSTSAGDLFLKHGTSISGAWTVVGVLDAKPDSGSLLVSPFAEGMIGAVAGLAAVSRPLIGRPSHYYGITPLLIFRRASGS
jgi:hypothetical protein